MKKSICFIVDTLAQHGAERYLFEICKSMNKKRFNISILSIQILNDGNSHYKNKIEELGIPVIIFDKNDLFPNEKTKILKKIKISFACRTKSENKIKRISQNNLFSKIEGFDIISVIKWEVYSKFSEVFDQHKNLSIHLLSGLDQYEENPYLNLTNKNHRFVTMYQNQKQELLNSDFIHLKNLNKLKFFNFPLALSSDEFRNTYNPCKTEFRLGVFTRISPDQPSLFHFFVLHSLIQEYSKVKLFFFGKQCYEPYKRLYHQTIRYLGLEDKVIFIGHVPSVKNAINEYQINLGCMNSIHDFIGYSSIEMIASGLPVVFFNIAKIKNTNNQKNNNNVFNSLTLYTRKILNIITNQIEQKNDLDKYKIEDQIIELEEYYLSNYE